MLVLSRKLGESLVIDENITVTVVDIQGDKIRLGIVAPQSVRVDRQEIYEKRLLSRQQQQAISQPQSDPKIGVG